MIFGLKICHGLNFANLFGAPIENNKIKSSTNNSASTVCKVCFVPRIIWWLLPSEKEKIFMQIYIVLKQSISHIRGGAIIVGA